MPARQPDMRILHMAREKGLITDDQLAAVREEHTLAAQQGRSKTPTGVAIERGILSEQDARDLETETWIRELPAELDVYRLARLLGRGGMAVVFEGQDTSLGKAVAIKLLLPEFCRNDAYLARFHREARIAAKLSHPNTVQVFRAGEHGGVQFLVMEYVEGETISAVIKRRGRIPEREALDMVLQVAGALEEASSLGILHRDIKPGNLLLSKWGVPKLADFGIAKEFTDIAAPRFQQSLTMGVVGTPTYMSPEQARGARDLDFRSDIYSLGATLYHMVIGDLPFNAATPQETMVRVVSESPRLPRTVLPTLSEPAGAVLCKMMAKSPDDRYQSFEELKTDLAAARDGEPVSLSYREAQRLLLPAMGRRAARRSPRADSLIRIGAIAGTVLVAGMMLLLIMAKGCG